MRTDVSTASVLLLAFLAVVAGTSGPLPAAGPARTAKPARNIEFETTSEFSHIRVKRQGSVRTLLFVRDNGEEVEESMVNMKRPHEMLVPYVRFMFTSYLFSRSKSGS